MPLFAKLLCLVNVLAAGGYIYLASLDYQARQQWSYEVFRHELVLDGLPLDDADPGHRSADKPLVNDLDADVLGLFANAKLDNPVKTQKEEVERRQKDLEAQLNKKPEAERRADLKAYDLRQARTVEEREDIAQRFANPKVTTKDLQGDFLARFEKAAADADGDKARAGDTRRADIAHLLYNLDPDRKLHQRLMVVIGLKAYAQESNQQGLLLSRLAYKVRRDRTPADQQAFAEAYQRQTEHVLALAYELQAIQTSLNATKTLVTQTDAQIKERVKEIAALEDEAKKARDDTTEALKQQKAIEKELFDAHTEIGKLQRANEKLERDIRRLELGRTQGGRP